MLVTLTSLLLLPGLSSAWVGGNVSDPDARNIGSRSGGYIYVAPGDWTPSNGSRVWAFDVAELWVSPKRSFHVPRKALWRLWCP